MTRIHYPKLKQLAKMSYTDPRIDSDGKKIFMEKEGQFNADGILYKGNYMVYNDVKMPGMFIAIHVSDGEAQDGGPSAVHIIAIDKDSQVVRNRMNYRMKLCKDMG